MIRARASTHDDRGREVNLVKPAQLARANADVAAAPFLAKFLAFATKAQSRQFSWRRAPIFFAGVAGLIACRVIIDLAIPGLPIFVGTAVFWIGLVLLIIGMRILTRRTSSTSLAATAISMGVCGSCGYSLEHLQPEADHCVVCPECGAAWKLFRITRPHYGPARDRVPRANWVVKAARLVPMDAQLMGVDARGAYFRMLDKRLRLLPAERRAELGAARVSTLRSALCRVGLGWRWLVALLPISILFFAYTVLVRTMGDVRNDDRWALACVLLILTGLFAWLSVGTIRSQMFAPATKRGPVAAALGVCNACGRDLRQGEPQPDGCVVCTGCGAAWRRSSPQPLVTEAPPQTGPEITLPPPSIPT
jgi:hypothetical protein